MNPRTAAEWATHCIVASNEASHLDAIPDELDALMCLGCADAYARERVEAALERRMAAIKVAVDRVVKEAFNPAPSRHRRKGFGGEGCDAICQPCALIQLEAALTCDLQPPEHICHLPPRSGR
mgnify:CR=1 FL=1